MYNQLDNNKIVSEIKELMENTLVLIKLLHTEKHFSNYALLSNEYDGTTSFCYLVEEMKDFSYMDLTVKHYYENNEITVIFYEFDFIVDAEQYFKEHITYLSKEHTGRRKVILTMRPHDLNDFFNKFLKIIEDATLHT